MKRLRLSSTLFLPSLLAGAVFACGGISDPTRGDEPVATVSGALTGTSVPAGARVALVWRNGTSGGWAVGAEAPIVNGQFSMTLPPPPDAYFFSPDSDDYEAVTVGRTDPAPPSAGPAPEPAEDPAPSSGGGSGGGSASKLAPKTTVSGGIAEPLAAAVAGFVVYVDANGNGQLDLEVPYAASPDTILGGNRELMLTFLKGGGSLDYEKLRDKSGILPAAGYNLAWEEGRWLPLHLVELKLTSETKLPSAVCSSYGSASGGGSGGSGGISVPEDEPNTSPPDPGGSMVDGGGGGGSYPDPSDPNLQCSPDGRTYYYSGNCPPPPPPPVGLCAPSYGGSYGCPTEVNSFAGDEPPVGWPCPVTIDGGVYDGGIKDGGADADAGPSDAGAG